MDPIGFVIHDILAVPVPIDTPPKGRDLQQMFMRVGVSTAIYAAVKLVSGDSLRMVLPFAGIELAEGFVPTEFLQPIIASLIASTGLSEKIISKGVIVSGKIAILTALGLVLGFRENELLPALVAEFSKEPLFRILLRNS